jgi:hypothetical protein
LSGNKRCREKRLNASTVPRSVDRRPRRDSSRRLPTSVAHYHNTRDKVATRLNPHKSFNGHRQVWTWDGIVKLNSHLNTVLLRTLPHLLA